MINLKKVLTILFIIINIMGFSSQNSGRDCEDDLIIEKNALLKKLNYGTRGILNESEIAYNTMVNNYNLASYGSKRVGCQQNLRTHKNLNIKMENLISTLNNQVNRNFNGKNQIPYNPNYSYNGYDVEYEVKKGDIEDSSGNTYTKVKKYYTNTPVEGTDHVGLIKYIYNVAGIKTGAFNDMELLDFAAITKYQVKPGVPLKPGDLIVMNYNNNSSIDTIGLVYQEANSQLKMLEMGGNMYEEGSSVKSFIPMTDSKNTAYVIPFETIMNKAFSVQDESDIRELQDITNSMQMRGVNTPLPISANNPNIVTYSTPRNQRYLAYNGFTSADPNVENMQAVNGDAVLKEVTKMTDGISATAVKGLGGFSALITVIMIFLITLNILWAVFKGGLHGSLDEIVKKILSEIALKSPYFVFVALYPVLMKNLITPLFLYRLPTYIFRDFIKVSGISMQNGQYVTYYDLMKHILKKGIPLIIGTFGYGITQQKISVDSIFKYFASVWKTFTQPTSFATAAWNIFGLIFSISRTIMQMTVFRPITSLAGLMTVITLLNIALNIFLSSLTFVISTSVGLFYMIFGMSDVTKSKSLNTLQIIISGFLQYLVNFAMIIVLAMIVEMLGKESLGVILTPFNFVKTIQVFICISIIQTMVKQVGVSISTNF